MAFNGWLKYCSITIPSSATTSATTNVSGMPVLLTGDNLPVEISACKSDGSDIRFSTTSAGSDDLPREIITINKTDRSYAMYVKVPEIKKGSDTTIYCFWNNPDASEPGKGTTSQLQNVWSDFYGVFHFNSLTSAWKGIDDSSDQYTNMTVIGTPAPTSGYAKGTSAINISTTCGMSYNELVYFSTATNVTAFDFSFWINQRGTNQVFNFGTGTNGITYGMLTAGQFGVSWGLLATTTSAIPATGWNYVHARGVNGTYVIYVNGVDKTNGGGSANANAFTTFGLGTTAGGPTTAVGIADFRMTRNKNTPVDNIKLQYVNYSNPKAFSTYGTVYTKSVETTLSFSGLKTGTEIRIYAAGTQTELAGVESSSTTWSYSYSYSTDTLVDIVIFNVLYEPIRYTNFTLTNANTTIPVQQRLDRNYLNP